MISGSRRAFRSQALARIATLETCWDDLKGGVAADHALDRLRSDVLMLKGESSVVGLRPVAHLCEKLEDVLSAPSDSLVADGLLDLVLRRSLSRLGVAAATAFVEYQSAAGSSRKRLRNLWLLLRQEIEEREGAPLEMQDVFFTLERLLAARDRRQRPSRLETPSTKRPRG